ncbi:MAG: ABC transporter ATP-binding protein [Lachnospiraceae bacterium]|nr:ABC transporter ATP-binding protein [Lachnospiraceae bacterium]
MKSEKMSLKEAFKLHTRAIKIIKTESPSLILMNRVWGFLKAALPYGDVYLSAKIIGELADGRDPKRLMLLVSITLIWNLVLASICSVIEDKDKSLGYLLWLANDKFLADKMMNMDYCHLDKQSTHDRVAQIRQNANWHAWGIYTAYEAEKELASSLFGILGVVVLTVTLFIKKIPVEAGRLTILNTPYMTVVIVAIYLFTVYLASHCGNLVSAGSAALSAGAREGNRFYNLYSRYAFDSTNQKSADIRMYDQFNICKAYKIEERAFGKNGAFAKFYKGKGGILLIAQQALLAVFTGMVYLYVCLKAYGGAFDIGYIAQYVGALTAFSGQMILLLEGLSDIRLNGSFLQTLYEHMDLPDEMYQGSLTTEKRNDCKYEIEFKDVSFKYPDSDIWALRHLNVKFKVGQKLAVVGQNGSGKTTFIKLLCRLYDPTEGQILLNGIDIRKYAYKEYMDIFSVVFQDFELLAAPLGENVAVSKKYDKEKVKAALIQAGFGERLETMEKGLDTCLYKEFEEDGVEISGGEAQKIAIARALYKDAAFIILDEPTAALDPLAEAEVYEKFSGMVGNRTAVYISHRLSSCKFCDEIMVFDEGAVIQHGTHESLLSDLAGKYYALWNAQAKYYQ